ncbi:hypothetical protein FACS189499_02460 [Clostridia bacterium]|nr:hypothetical protein FACS189499_02460 [Clostridia bacterium]
MYTSADSKIAKVSGSGVVTAVAKGTTTITGKAGNKSAKITIKVS